MSARILSLAFHRFVLEDAARPRESTLENLLLSKRFRLTWNFASTETAQYQSNGSHSGAATCGSLQSMPLPHNQTFAFTSMASELVCSMSDATTEVMLEPEVFRSFSLRVIVLQLVEVTDTGRRDASGSRSPSEKPLGQRVASFASTTESRISSSNLTASGSGSMTRVFASASIDPAAFGDHSSTKGRNCKDYCVKMESNFAVVGKLFFKASLESLESRDLASRTQLESRLILRMDRVVSTMTSRRGGAVVVPLGSSLRDGGGASTSSDVTSVVGIRRNREHIVQVRMSTHPHQVHQTPVSVSDCDGRVRWGYEMVIAVPLGNNTDPSAPETIIRPRLLFALLDGSTVVSNFALDLAKVKTKTDAWTEYGVPAPMMTVTSSPIEGGIVTSPQDPRSSIQPKAAACRAMFEFSAKHVDILILKTAQEDDQKRNGNQQPLSGQNSGDDNRKQPSKLQQRHGSSGDSASPGTVDSGSFCREANGLAIPSTSFQRHSNRSCDCLVRCDPQQENVAHHHQRHNNVPLDDEEVLSLSSQPICGSDRSSTSTIEPEPRPNQFPLPTPAAVAAADPTTQGASTVEKTVLKRASPDISMPCDVKPSRQVVSSLDCEHEFDRQDTITGKDDRCVAATPQRDFPQGSSTIARRVTPQTHSLRERERSLESEPCTKSQPRGMSQSSALHLSLSP